MINKLEDCGKITLDFPEFLNFMAKKIKDTNIEEELIETFKVFDKDGNGLITVTQFIICMKNLGKK